MWPTAARAARHPSMRPRPSGRGIGEQIVEEILPCLPSMRPRPSGRGIFGNFRKLIDAIDPSMRPRPSGRGIDRPRGNEGCRTISFNEASTIRSRNPEPLAERRLLRLGPSMRPRPSGRGIWEKGTRAGECRMPSMRPRPSGRGIRCRLLLPHAVGRPSMRPRPSGRGIGHPVTP